MFSIEMMRAGWFAPTLNLDNVDPRCGDLADVFAYDMDDLHRVVRQYLREDNRTVVTLKPVTTEESRGLGPLA